MEETKTERLIRSIRLALRRHKDITGYTFEQLADGCGVNRSTLIEFLGERRIPDTRILVAIEQYLDRMRDPEVRKARRTRHPARELLHPPC